MITKAVLLVAGEGRRLAPMTATRPKHMIPLAGKPLLEHTLLALKDIGISSLLLVVGYKREKIQEYFGDGSQFGLTIEYVVQEDFLGTANATELGAEFTKDDPFVMMYGDLLVDPSVLKDFREFYQAHPADAIISLRAVPDPSKYGIISLDAADRVQQIVEKPPETLDLGNLANAGIYVLNAKIYDAIARTPLSPRNEYELTDSLQLLVEEDQTVLGFTIGDKFWSDVGHPWQLLAANQYFLDTSLVDQRAGTIEANVQVRGKVFVGEGSIIKSGTYIEGPAYIGKGCSIGPNAYIRPHAAIGNGCKVGNSSEVKASILLDSATIPHLSYVGDSIIGEGVNFGAGTTTANLRLDKADVKMTIKGRRVSTGCKKMGAVVGDHVQTGIHVTLMPGVKVGPRARIGANTTVTRDVPARGVFYARTEAVLEQRAGTKEKSTKK